MDGVPLDAQQIVDDLRAARRERGVTAQRWVPSESFEATLGDAARRPVLLSYHLGWMHRNWDLRSALAPDQRKGVKGLVKRATHRLVMVVLGPYLDRLQDYVGVNVRALDELARRVDEQGAAQLRLLAAVRSDLIDFSRQVDQRLDP
ncbi:MAG: hypothetical protein ACRDZP_03230 [Acidimicrobiales bacterium]